MMILVKIFLAAFFLNLLYEMLHSLLYTTCLEAPLKRYVYLMMKACLFDASAITLIYVISLGNWLVFVVASLLLAYFWEWHSLRKKKWQYAPTMPQFLGVGVTPLLQLAITGIISICAATYF